MENVNMKPLIRKSIFVALKNMHKDKIEMESSQIAQRIYSLTKYKVAKAIGVYLDIPYEAMTNEIMTHAFHHGKKVYVPKIIGSSAQDMVMLQTQSIDDINTFPKDKWNILDPPITYLDGSMREDAINSLDLDLIIVPGVAFDCQGGRLGRGKGYYDSYLERYNDKCIANGIQVPYTVALCLSPQLIDTVPMSTHDQRMDYVVTPNDLISTITI